MENRREWRAERERMERERSAERKKFVYGGKKCEKCLDREAAGGV